jgi:DNA-binding transcriptional LysR family regulator
MELRHIRYFLALVEERNFTRAAARVGIVQSAFSSQIRDLEKEVGARLFHRVPHGAELTSAGQAFLEAVRTIPAAAERAAHAAGRAARGETGRLKVGFTASSAFNPAFPAAIKAFRQAYPDINLVLEEANTTRLIEGLEDGTLDAVFLRPSSGRVEAFQLRLLSEEPLLAALPASHPAASSDEVDLADLAGQPLLLFPREIGPTLFDSAIGAFREAGVEPDLGQSAPQIASVLILVAAEMGVSVVPASMSQLCIPGVVFRAIKGQAPTARLSLATRRGDTNVIVRNFLSCALSRAAAPAGS